MKNIDIARLTPETWPARREALVKLFGQEEYGVVPAGWTSSFVWEKELEKDGLHGRLGCVTVEYKGRSMSFPFALWLPEKTSEPVPCAIQISCHDPVVHDQMKGIDPVMREKFMGMMKELIGNEDHFNVMIDDMMAPKEPNTLDITCDVEKGYWPVRQLLADGYAAAAIYASSLAPDEGDSWKQEGLYPLFYGAGERPADGFGCLTAWGFGAQRVLDALLTCPEIDPKRISVAGHSRAGKAALWAAVQDERFATVLANNSGCCGVAMNVGKLGERVASMCQMMPRWFCKNFLKYSAMAVEQMPKIKDYFKAEQRMGELYAAEIYEETWQWLNERSCASLINPMLLEQYAMSASRWVQLEGINSQYGFITKTAQGVVTASPFVAQAQAYMKQTNQLWYQIYQIVKENCSTTFDGTPQDDLMERLLKARDGDTGR